jgi:hypothetical protein
MIRKKNKFMNIRLKNSSKLYLLLNKYYFFFFKYLLKIFKNEEKRSLKSYKVKYKYLKMKISFFYINFI